MASPDWPLPSPSPAVGCKEEKIIIRAVPNISFLGEGEYRFMTVEDDNKLIKEALSVLIRKWRLWSIFVFCPFYCEKNWHKLRKLFWIWQVATVRSINHNVGCPKRAELPDVNINTGPQSINTERGSLKWTPNIHLGVISHGHIISWSSSLKWKNGRNWTGKRMDERIWIDPFGRYKDLKYSSNLLINGVQLKYSKNVPRSATKSYIKKYPFKTIIRVLYGQGQCSTMAIQNLLNFQISKSKAFQLI